MKFIKNAVLVIFSAIVTVSLPLNAAEDLSSVNYLLDSGDTIRISIFGEDDMLLETKLDESGLITYPYFDDPITVKGLSVKQLENYLVKGLVPDVFINPSIQITVVEYRPFFINGEVNDAGGYPYQPGLNVSKAITLAGGMTERASESNIFIIRANDPDQQRIKVSLSDKISPGDIVTVEESFF